MSKKITVLGAGSWGTALAHHLRRSGNYVCLWGRDKEVLDKISSDQENPKYFNDLKLAKGIVTEADLLKAVTKAAIIVIAVPSSAVRKVIEVAKTQIREDVVLVSTSKGLEPVTLDRMSEVLAEVLGESSKISILSGPSFSLEVIKGLPTAVTIAAKDLEVAKEAASSFHKDYFRVYTSDDLVGVELGGVVKNVIALAAGILDGMKMGQNARAALITRGAVEIQRLVSALGGKPSTVYGLSGLGDLVLTATGDLSRNRRVGLMLGEGKKLDQILSSLGQVAEAVKTTRSLLEIATKNNVEMPIVSEVDKILSGERSPKESVEMLFSRVAKSE